MEHDNNKELMENTVLNGIDEIKDRLESVEKQLQELNTQTALASKEFFDTEEAAHYTGLSTSTIHKLTAGRKISFFKAREGAKKNYYTKDALTRFVLHQHIRSDESLAEEAASYCVTGRKEWATFGQKANSTSGNNRPVDNRRCKQNKMTKAEVRAIFEKHMKNSLIFNNQIIEISL